MLWIHLGSGADCEVRILNQGLCRQQAYLTIIDSVCTIVDMGNGGPMKVNNIETTKTTLIDGDVISFGESTLKIKLL